MTTKSKRILCVGLVCLDIINVCKSYPLEDSDQRCIEQRWQRGGNASNNCTVFSQIGVPCEFFGTMAKGHELGFIIKDFRNYGIVIDNCVFHDNSEFPTASVIINAVNGSRTIIHSNRNLPELTLTDFQKLDLTQYCWIHFEGRNMEAVISMITHVENWNKSRPENQRLTVSVEAEKARPELQDFLGLADVLFVGKDYATFRGCGNMTETIKNIAEHTKPNATIICPWGERGAMARGPDGSIVQSPAFVPSKVLDTLAAGDTFNAAAMYGLISGRSLQDSIVLGCEIAGAKVGLRGFEGLDKASKKILARHAKA